jgi:hypothetical protein
METPNDFHIAYNYIWPATLRSWIEAILGGFLQPNKPDFPKPTLLKASPRQRDSAGFEERRTVLRLRTVQRFNFTV